MVEIKSMSREELAAFLKELGEPKFREKQVFQWLHRGVESFDEMTNLSKSLREKLKENCVLTVPKVARKQISKMDGTVKYLWELSDGNCVESVVMRYKHGNTICVSSEVGCLMGCAFCASTLAGLVRRLTAAEILDQVIFAQKDSGLPINNIVMMGIGEPLDNFDNVLRFLQLVNDPDGLNIGMRHISLSTCGLVDKIDRLAELDLQLTLSVSLHAPDDETRCRLMPVNKAVGVDKLMQTCRNYFKKTGRRISYEYAMVDGVNDSDAQADLLVKLLKGQPGHVNLIPLNNVEESPLKPSRRVREFQNRLERQGVTATVRRKLGDDIDAACGQLRRKEMKKNEAVKPAQRRPNR
ncbi:MAG: 23S rRNA (adenine(2503)-C(2))-methyltransferase RlmN [Oscillospiraceae bacterium]|nr:23S rRNA (adenine(2503)-C(2))-methyltransferase RlmN [Oscillospiraceae bacterium]